MLSSPYLSLVSERSQPGVDSRHTIWSCVESDHPPHTQKVPSTRSAGLISCPLPPIRCQFKKLLQNFISINVIIELVPLIKNSAQHTATLILKIRKHCNMHLMVEIESLI